MINFKIILASILWLSSSWTIAKPISNINIINNLNQFTVILTFHDKTICSFFSLQNPERMVVDISKSDLVVQGLPIFFSSNHLIKRIRTSIPIDKRNLRLVFDLTHRSHIKSITHRFNGSYNIILTVKKNSLLIPSKSESRLSSVTSPSLPANRSMNDLSVKKKQMREHSTKIPILKSIPISSQSLSMQTELIVVAIDAGHGGQDFGAIGPNGLHEKNVTIALANKLKRLLDDDPMFKPVLTRDGDYFISVMDRSNIARKENADVLISIHADSSPNRCSASGASIWVLSNKRANSEMNHWLKKYEQQSELLGGFSNLLVKHQTDPYFNRVILDLQFQYSQRVSYSIAINILNQLKKISVLHKRYPAHASFGVLRSPDIPSLLVETGFISNVNEEKLLGNDTYQKKIANALHLGLRSYFLSCPLHTKSKQTFYTPLKQCSLVISK